MLESMRLYSYVVVRDFGFAPNPFYGVCTLATCKPQIRRTAQVGDWVIGTGSKQHGRQRQLVYAMKVSETMTFDEYWDDPRFECKKPNLSGSRKQAFGDNVYHREAGRWLQADSHHSCPGGRPNPNNVRRDTSADKVLAAEHFVYFGSKRQEIPARFNICKSGTGHRCRFPRSLVNDVELWLLSLNRGFHKAPADWPSMPWVPSQPPN